jgi:hypothetical protein
VGVLPAIERADVNAKEISKFNVLRSEPDELYGLFCELSSESRWLA